MTGLSVPTIRNWEERYAAIVPERGTSGQRLYSRDQIEELGFVARQVEEGLSPADAHRLITERRGAASTADGPRSPDGGRQLAILLAEWDPYAADFAEFFLRTEGYDVLLAFDVDRVRDVVAVEAPDLVVLEWLINGGVGRQLCRELRARSDRPILVVSSLAGRDAAIDAGADAFLQKPLDPLLFISTIKDLLGESAFVRKGRRVPA
jgi:CheY-like chemotaxis protein